MATPQNHLNGTHQPIRRLVGGDSLPAELPRKTLLERALQYSRIPGFEPIPVIYGQKKPLDGKGWQKRAPRTEAELRKVFSSGRLNIGTRLGVLGLTDVDLDCDEAITLAPHFLPDTGFIFGRASKRRSHWFYYSDPPLRIETWQDPVSKHKILELRGLKKNGTRGLQTVLPGSLRAKDGDDPPDATDEWVEFDLERTPQNVDAQEVIDACADIYAAVVMARLFPAAKSGRNEAFLAFAGMLAMGGYTLERAIRIHQGIFRLLWPDTPWTSQAAAQVEQTYAKYESGAQVTGFTRLEQLGLDRKHLQAIERRLGLKAKRRSEIDVNLHNVSLQRSNNDVVTDIAKHQSDADWTSLLTRGENNQVHSNVWNTAICLSRHPAMRKCLSFDDFRSDIIVGRSAPDGLRPGALDELGLIDIRCWVELHFLHKVAKETVADAVIKAARAQTIHPVRDYLESLRWDGTERVASLFPHYFGSARDLSREEFTRLSPYWEAVSKMFGISAVARVFQPGCQVDHMLVLEGEQGIGKSRALRTLFGSEWFTDQMPPLESKDASLQLSGMWCIEFAEFAALQRTSNAAVKAFLTRRIERYRPPYGSKVSDFPRQCVFAATVNPEEYFTDTTGNRRYWPVSCIEIRCDLLAQDRDQLWAEYVHLYKQSIPWWPSKALECVFKQEQEAREVADAWVQPIAAWLRDGNCPAKITTHHILERLNVPSHQQTKATQMRVADILRSTFKCEPHRKTKLRWYERTAVTEDILYEMI